MQDSKYTIEVDQIEKPEWSEALLKFDDATIYQTWSYGTVHWKESNLSHLVLKRSGEVVGLAQVSIKKIPVVNLGIAYIPWGPLWQTRGNPTNYADLKHLIQALKEEYVKRRGLLLRIAPNVVDDAQEEMRSLLEREDFHLNKSIPPYRTYILDLSPSLQELRKGLNQKWRNQLNRAEKNALTIIEGDSDELYQKFMNLQNETLDRKKYIPGVDYEEFRKIQKELPEPLKMKIMICEYEGESINVAICTAIGNTAIYLLGATADIGLQLKGAYLLQWAMIRYFKERGCRWYDLGGINPERNPGVFHFKAGLSGKDVYHIGQFESYESLLSSCLVDWGEKCGDRYSKMKLAFNEFRNKSRVKQKPNHTEPRVE